MGAMPRLCLAARLSAVLLALLAGLAGPDAEGQALPTDMLITEPDTDFPGQDIGAVFDTNLDTCRRLCLDEDACRAFTFNARNGACFLKSGIAARTTFQGALSVRLEAIGAEAQARAAERSIDLAFLPAGALDLTREQALGLVTRYQSIPWSPAKLLFEAGQAEEAAAEAGDTRRAMGLYGAALNAGAGPQAWAGLARTALALAGEDRRNGQALLTDATGAAVNAYLRLEDPDRRAAVLRTIARALEGRGEGKATIGALRLAQDLAPSDATAAALDQAIARHGFRILEHRVDANAARPRICVVLSEPLVKAGLDYAPFVRVTGADLPVEAEGNQICVDGVRHGASYRVTLRQGLPAASGEVLRRSASLDVYVRDRAPSVSFPGRGYVLAKAGRAAIPVQTVNVDEVALAIHRVGERNLLRLIQRGLLRGTLNAPQEAQIANRLGEAVWRGTGSVEMALNQTVTTAMPIGEAIGQIAPGVYVMTARAPSDNRTWEKAATQWFIVTDLGLATLSGDDGLHVFVRSLATAEGLEGARLTLLAANNEVLGEAVSDAEGYARFAPGLVRGAGGAGPALITVALDGADESADFAFLDLSVPGFDLSDRGVEGRRPPGPVDVFLTTERGAYRPGETIHATALARDADGRAVGDVALTGVLNRPDGVEHSRHLMRDQGAGGRALSLPLAPGAQRGTWRLAVHLDPEAPALAQTSVLVEDFVPERIDVELTAPEGAVAPGAPPMLDIVARYLYGAPGAGLAIEGTLRVEPADGLPGHPGYRFGLEDDRPVPRADPLPQGLVTDEQGRAQVPLSAPDLGDATHALQVTATVRVRDSGGRPVERSLTRPLLPAGPRIGLRPLFTDTVEEGGQAEFDLIAVGPTGARIDLPGVAWTLTRLQTEYQWYKVDGRWSYEPITTRERVASGEVALTAEGPKRIGVPVDWGRYELEVATTAAPFAASSMTFSAGWFQPVAAADTPDRLEVALDRPRYRIGEEAELRIVAREAGKVLVTVLDTGLVDMLALDVEPGAHSVRLPVTEAWGPGAYVAASLIRPLAVAEDRNPSRALGIAWAEVDPGARRLQPSFRAPDQAAPRGPLQADLAIDGLAPGETAYATIAAVDLGILNLTGFEPPAPDAWVFGQRRLGVEMLDLYGRLIDGLRGEAGRLRSGGDGPLQRSLAPPPTQALLASFSGVLQADGAGRVAHQVDLPAFNGTIRLMAVVWTAEGVGHAVKDVLVRDPVVVAAAMPRFLAPRDRSRVQLDLTHAAGPAGPVDVEIWAEGVTLGEGRSSVSRRVDLAEGGRAAISLALEAGQPGDGALTVAVTPATGKRIQQRYTLAVRANDPAVARQSKFSLAPGQELVVDAGTFAGLQPGSGRATLAVGPLARFDVPGLLAALDRYPYGCTEQQISRALPLLSANDLAEGAGLIADAALPQRIRGAIEGVLANQSAAGAFGLWRPGAGDLWLDAYATDFLAQAREAGYAVPNRAFQSALDNLGNRVTTAPDFARGGEDVAYALLVLARAGTASIGDLRYYADAKADALATALAKAQLGAALAAYGDRARSDRLFAAAMRQAAGGQEDRGWRADYGTGLRDAAGVLALAAETATGAVDREVLARLIAAGEPASPQEQAWTLMAAGALADDPSLRLEVDGAPADGPVMRLVDRQANQALRIRNAGDQPVSAVITTVGVPAEPEPAGGRGYAIARAYFTPQGEPVDPTTVPQNTRLIALLTVTETEGRRARLIVDDPLPAGFEIDNPRFLRSGDVGGLGWLGDLAVPVHAEFRTDRFIAAVTRGDDGGGFRLAYVVRAVSPGSFHHPAAVVEDMYRPAFRARTATGSVTVAPAG